MLLPSPGPALVTTSDPHALVRRREQHVGADRLDRLGESRRHVVAEQRSGRRCRSPGPCRGTGAPRCAFSSCGDLIRLSRYSKRNTRPRARTIPEISRQHEIVLTLRQIGARGTSAASTTRMLLVLSSPEMPVSFVRCSRLRRSGDCSRRRAAEHRVLDALAVQAERFGLLRVQRAHQAVFLRERRLVLGLHRLDDLGDLAVELGLLRSERRCGS